MTTKTEYTPGPCIAKRLQRRSITQPTYTIHPAAGGAAIADVGPCDGDREYALVFAAAPDLLTELRYAREWIVGVLRSTPPETYSDPLPDIDAALAKALPSA